MKALFTITMAMMTMITNVEKRKIDQKISEWKEQLKGKDPKVTFKRLAFINLFVAISALIIYDPIINFVLNWQLQLNPGGMFLKLWQDLPADVYCDIYLYEIRNGKQFLGGQKPNLLEHGPFIFEMKRKRRIVAWKPTTVVFKERFTTDFRQDLSHESIETRMKVMNTTIFSIISWVVYWMKKFMIKFLNPIIHNILVLTLQTFNERIIEDRSAKEILIGRQIDILRFIELASKPLQMVGINYDIRNLMTNFGNYKLNNNSISIMGILTGNEFGPFEVTRFADGQVRVNQFVKILEKTTFDEFQSPCNRFRSIYDPLYFGYGEQSDTIDIWVQHFCRPLRFINNGTDWKHGIRSHLYEISRHLFDIRKRENQCYCHDTERLIDCDGYTNVAGCFGGLPFALSFPHFFGHPRLQSGVYGLNPNSETHLSHMNLEPNMGILFDAELKFQLNIIMKDFPTIGQLGQIQNGLLPFFKISLNIQTSGPLHGLLVVGSFLLLTGKFMFILFCLTLSTFFLYRSYKY
ncbi:cd36 [Dermatophagoides farinae]|uniref:Scavenger receptor class B member 1 n=1 Tax=Dermatophagoides farinae TaxID=6954 RepID=A0A922L5N1_DERFA|nr:cd36 [Dermatophagoides farinae]